MKQFFCITLFIVLSNLGFAQGNAYQVKVTGHGQPIVFLPGFTCPGEDGTIPSLTWNLITKHINLPMQVLVEFQASSCLGMEHWWKIFQLTLKTTTSKM